MWSVKIILLVSLISSLASAQLTINNEGQKKSIPENKPIEAEPLPSAADNITYVENDNDKEIPYNFAVAPKTWGIGTGLSVGDIISPKALDTESSAGLGFQLWGRYQLNEHLGSQFGLYQHDYSDTSLGITALQYSLLFQTGWPDGYYPYFGLGVSLNNVNKSDTYGKDYTQVGWQMALGAHIPSENMGKRVFFIPEIEFFQVFEKNNDAKAITSLAFVISLGYFFDAEDFSKNVSLINGK